MTETTVREPVFVARGLRQVYEMGEVTVEALRGVDFELFEGEFIVLLDPSRSWSTSCRSMPCACSLARACWWSSGAATERWRRWCGASSRRASPGCRRWVSVVRDGRAVQTALMLGHQNGLEAEVTDGLEPGAILNLHPSDTMLNGTRVRGRARP